MNTIFTSLLASSHACAPVFFFFTDFALKILFANFYPQDVLFNGYALKNYLNVSINMSHIPWGLTRGRKVIHTCWGSSISDMMHFEPPSTLFLMSFWLTKMISLHFWFSAYFCILVLWIKVRLYHLCSLSLSWSISFQLHN